MTKTTTSSPGKARSTNCGDWGRGWGFGPYNHIGKLSTTDKSDEFLWTGHQQGRHGQKWNPGIRILFSVDKDGTITEIERNKGSLPDYRDIHLAIEKLKVN